MLQHFSGALNLSEQLRRSYNAGVSNNDLAIGGSLGVSRLFFIASFIIPFAFLVSEFQTQPK